MADWSTSATGSTESPALVVTSTGSRMLFWIGVDVADTLIRIKRSVDSGITYTQIAEFPSIDGADIPVFAYEIFDAGSYRIYSYKNGTETEIMSKWYTNVIPTPDSELQRVTRRAMGVIRSEVAFTDREIREAYKDALLEYVNLDISKSYVCAMILDQATGKAMPIGIGTTMTDAHKLLLGYGAAKQLLEGLLVDRSRKAISMDSPTGRINTTVAPSAIKDALDHIATAYDRQLDRILLSSGNIATTIYADTSNILPMRGYDTE